MNTNQPQNGVPAKAETLFKVVGDWNVQSLALKAKFPQLTDGDLKLEAGRENEMLKSMEVRLYKNREEVINIIEASRIEKKI